MKQEVSKLILQCLGQETELKILNHRKFEAQTVKGFVDEAAFHKLSESITMVEDTIKLSREKIKYAQEIVHGVEQGKITF